jgi:hypothetical protein
MREMRFRARASSGWPPPPTLAAYPNTRHHPHHQRSQQSQRSNSGQRRPAVNKGLIYRRHDNSRTSTDRSGSQKLRTDRGPPRRQLHLGGKFQNFCLANFHVLVASSIASQSRLWNPSKLWAVAQAYPGCLKKSLVASCLGDRPSNFGVCIFGPALFTFSVANSSTAAALLIRRSFSVGPLKLAVVSSSREAFGLSLAHRREEEDDRISNFEFLPGAIRSGTATGGPPLGSEGSTGISHFGPLPAQCPTQPPPAHVPLTVQENREQIRVNQTLPVVNSGHPASSSHPAC